MLESDRILDELHLPRKSIPALALERLCRLLEEGDYGPGDRLPSQRDIAESLRISRPSVREALAVLQAIGLVEIHHGRGVFVTERPALGAVIRSISAILLRSITFSEVFEVRKSIEMDVARLAAKNASPEQIEMLTDRANTMRALVDPDEFVNADLDFHMNIALAGGNGLWLYMLDMVRSLLHTEIISVVHLPGRLAAAALQHVQIAQAIASRDADRAAEMMAVHLSIHEEMIRDMTNSQLRDRKKAPTG